jgi:hypothetical protein
MSLARNHPYINHVIEFRVINRDVLNGIEAVDFSFITVNAADNGEPIRITAAEQHIKPNKYALLKLNKAKPTVKTIAAIVSDVSCVSFA